MTKPASNREAELLQAFVNKPEQYGFELAQTVERLIGKEIPFGTLYTTLDRMKDKGYITVRLGETGKNRGGRRKKFYKITGEGQRALRAYEFLNMGFVPENI